MQGRHDRVASVFDQNRQGAAGTFWKARRHSFQFPVLSSPFACSLPDTHRSSEYSDLFAGLTSIYLLLPRRLFLSPDS